MDVILQADGGSGGGFPVGSVSVGNDDDGITITYTITEAGWELLETHLAVYTDWADMPLTRKGNPKIGKFPYSTSYEPGDSVTGVTYDLTLDELDASVGDELYISTHAVVAMVHHDDELGEYVIDWAESVYSVGGTSQQFMDDRGWATYFIYDLQSHDL